jgi:hypothetical protein
LNDANKDEFAKVENAGTAVQCGEVLIPALHQASGLNAQLLRAFSSGADNQSEDIVGELEHDRRNLQNLRLGISIAMLNE